MKIIKEHIKIKEFDRFGVPYFLFEGIPCSWVYFLKLSEIIEEIYEAKNLMTIIGHVSLYKINDFIFELNYDEDEGYYLNVTSKNVIIEDLMIAREIDKKKYYKGFLDKESFGLRLEERKEIIEPIIKEKYNDESFDYDEWYDINEESDLIDTLDAIDENEIEVLRQLANKIANKLFLEKKKS